MYMVRHDDKFAKLSIWKVIRDFQPAAMRLVAERAQFHQTVDNPAKQTPAVLRNDGNEVSSRLRVIIPLQPNRTPVVLLRIVCHVPLRHFCGHYAFFLPTY